MKLAGLKFNLNVEINDIDTREINLDNFNKNLEDIFSSFMLVSKENNDTVNDFKEEVKQTLLTQYISNNSLIMITNETSDSINEALDEIKRRIDEIIQKYNELSKEEFDEWLKKTSNEEEKIKRILSDLGLNENSTDEEMIAVAEEKANELIDALNNDKKTENDTLNSIIDEVKGGNNSDSDGDNKKNKGPKGLRKDIYEKIKAIGDKGLDIDCFKYAKGIAESVTKYFSSGIMHICTHTGGFAIFGIGVGLLFMAKQNEGTGTSIIQEGTRSKNYIDQAKKMADGISNMYDNAKINTSVVGMMQIPGSPSPTPLSSKGEQILILNSSVKVIIMISVLAAFIMLAAGGIASMTSKSQESWNKMLGTIGAKDGNDLFAALVAAGVKTSIAATLVLIFEQTAMSSGTATLIPIKP